MATRKKDPKIPTGADDAEDGSPKARDDHGGGDRPDADALDGTTKDSGERGGAKPTSDPKWNREHDSSRNGRGYGPDGSMNGEEREVVTTPPKQRPTPK